MENMLEKCHSFFLKDNSCFVERCLTDTAYSKAERFFISLQTDCQNATCFFFVVLFLFFILGGFCFVFNFFKTSFHTGVN